MDFVTQANNLRAELRLAEKDKGSSLVVYRTSGSVLAQNAPVAHKLLLQSKHGVE